MSRTFLDIGRSSPTVREKTTRRPRVCMVVAGDLFGGAERQLISLCNAGRAEFDATVAFTLPGPVSEIATASGLSVIDLSRSLASGIRGLKTLLHGGLIDIVHCHGYRASVMTAVARVRRQSVPVIRTIHGAPESKGARKLALYEGLGRLADWTTAARHVYVSRELASRSAHPQSALVIHNGVDLHANVFPRPTAFVGGHFHIVAVGRLEPVKGIETLIEAVAETKLRNSAYLHLVGDGPLRRSLEQRSLDFGVGDRVVFHGFRKDALAFIAHADALALPSLHEGIPYVLLEALALGTPVVATSVGGIPEVIRDGREGLLVAPRAPEQVAHALNRLRQDPALVAALRTAGKARIAEEFSADRMAQRYAALFRDVLGWTQSDSER